MPVINMRDNNVWKQNLKEKNFRKQNLRDKTCKNQNLKEKAFIVSVDKNAALASEFSPGPRHSLREGHQLQFTLYLYNLFTIFDFKK